jgi:hypothetical protein
VGIRSETPLNINLNINNEIQDCKIGTVCGEEGNNTKGEDEWRRLIQGCMVDGLHVLVWNRTKEPLAIALVGVGREVRGRKNVHVTDVQ